jgi:hypothetical protein
MQILDLRHNPADPKLKLALSCQILNFFWRAKKCFDHGWTRINTDRNTENRIAGLQPAYDFLCPSERRVSVASKAGWKPALRRQCQAAPSRLRFLVSLLFNGGFQDDWASGRGHAPASRLWRTPRTGWRRNAAGLRYLEKSTPAGSRDSAQGSPREIIGSEDS